MRKISNLLFGFVALLAVTFTSGCNPPDPEETTYVVEFNTNGGNTINSQTIIEGELVQKPTDPDKDGFTFVYWSKSSTLESEYLFSSPVTSNFTLYAKWEQIKTYEISWVVVDEVVKVDRVIEGVLPVYDGPEPTYDGDEQYSYKFDSWRPIIVPAFEDTSYNAGFTRKLREYTITWYDEEGNKLKDEALAYGEIPSYDYAGPNDTAEWDYTLVGWSLTKNGEVITLPEVTSDADYYAIVSKIKKQYTVTFNSNGGSSVSSITQDYGSVIQKPSNPSRENYTFVSWCYDVELNNAVEWPLTLHENHDLYAKWNEKVPYATYLATLFDNYMLDPYEYIPEEMMPGYSETLLSSEPSIDYSRFPSLGNIPFGGFGEQWDMVLTNLEQSKLFFDVLTVVDTLSATSIVAFNNHIDSNPSDSATHTFVNGIYNVTIKFENNTIYYVLDYTNTFPVIGEQTAQIALSYNIRTKVKVGRIQLGAANALRYEVTLNSYEFALKYLGIRRAYFEISLDDEGNMRGEIFEFLGVDDVYSNSSCAQFYNDQTYFAVVGNKASSMVAWDGTINELYDVSTGKLLGYGVRETLLTVQYDTFWYNLNSFEGITYIKFKDNPDAGAGKNPHLVYINNYNTAPFQTTLVGGISLKSLSRRYDIELRKQYFYHLSDGELVKNELEIPMLFVQKDFTGSLLTDLINANNPPLTKFGYKFPLEVRQRLASDYSTLIDIFIAQKNSVTSTYIVDFIGSLYSHN